MTLRMNEGMGIGTWNVRSLYITVASESLDTVVMKTNWSSEEGSCKNEELIILV
jgi:hypothetical protein